MALHEAISAVPFPPDDQAPAPQPVDAQPSPQLSVIEGGNSQDLQPNQIEGILFRMRWELEESVRAAQDYDLLEGRRLQHAERARIAGNIMSELIARLGD